jgi:hypothetical protein
VKLKAGSEASRQKLKLKILALLASLRSAISSEILVDN